MTEDLWESLPWGMVNNHQRLGAMHGPGLGLSVGTLEGLIMKGRDRNLFLRRMTGTETLRQGYLGSGAQML